MKTLKIELPDQLAGEVEKAVEGGWFKNADELVLQALRDFVSSRRFELLEQQQLDDIAWALREKCAGKDQAR
jgi:Arc/MetJ-type ribon-helix-helix transcriptional regulator